MLQIIRNNPYRFLGVCSNSPTAERLSNARRINAFLKVNKEVSFPLDLATMLQPLARTAEGLNVANNSINLPKDQLKYAMFWFISATSIDKMAIDYIKEGNTAKGKELLGKKTSFSSLINRGVLAFIAGDNGEAISCITGVIHNDDYRMAFVESVCGATFKMAEDEVAQLFIETLLEEIKVGELATLFDHYGASQDDGRMLHNRMIAQPVEAINNAVAQAKNVKSNDAEAQYQAGMKLMESTKDDLQAVRSILGESNTQYQMVADNLAKQILQCGINYYNNSSEDEEVEIERAFSLQNYALSIAMGKTLKDRCRDNVDILIKKRDELPPREVRYYDKMIKAALDVYMKQPDEISYAIALIKKTVPYLMSIKEELGGADKYYLHISTLVVNTALHNVIEEFNGFVNDGLKLKLIQDHLGTVARLHSLFNNAWQATLYMDKLDMEPEFRRGRYKTNRDSLKNQVEDVVSISQSVTLDMRGDTQMYKSCRTVKDLSNYLSIFPEGKYAGTARERIEKMELDACRTTDDCLKFVRKYPGTKLDVKAKREECSFKQCSTIMEYEFYLMEYPGGKFASQAKARIEELVFGKCQSIIDFMSYLSKFPHGKYVSQAQRAIADEDTWSRCVAADSKEAYKDYLAKFPDGRHKAEAEKKTRACYIATMVYGDYDHPQVVVLRGFRDNTLRHHALGRAFIRFYYRNAPSWVEKMRGKTAINRVIRTILDNFIKLIKS